MYGELNSIRVVIQKNSGKAYNESEGLFFSYNRKLLGQNLKVSEFLARDFKDLDKDGWVHIQYGKQERFGSESFEEHEERQDKNWRI